MKHICLVAISVVFLSACASSPEPVAPAAPEPIAVSEPAPAVVQDTPVSTPAPEATPAKPTVSSANATKAKPKRKRARKYAKPKPAANQKQKSIADMLK